MKLFGQLMIAGAVLSSFAMATQASDMVALSPEAATNGFSLNDQLVFPPFDPAIGHKVFAEKGCVVCHQMNGIGGEDGPDLTYGAYDTPINAMEVASDLWEKAAIMIPMQEDELGGQIELSPEELAGLIGFLASPEEQKTFSMDDVPENIRADMDNMD